jgi:hypothetical protein
MDIEVGSKFVERKRMENKNKYDKGFRNNFVYYSSKV